MSSDAGSLGALRHLVARLGARVGLRATRISDLVIAVNEVAINSLRYGGGAGVARAWPNGEDVVCEIRDVGRIEHPLIDRRRPGAAADSSRGLWLANQL